MSRAKMMIGLTQLLREVQKTGGRAKHRCFSVEGYRLIERALESGAGLRGVVLARRMVERPTQREAAILTELTRRGTPLALLEEEEIVEWTGGRSFGPILGLVEALSPISWDDLLVGRGEKTLLVLYEPRDPGNIGALIRTGKASSVTALVQIGGTDPFHPKAVRTSMGAIFDLPILRVEDGRTTLMHLRNAGFQNIGAVVREGLSPSAGILKMRRALWMGSEAHGLPPDLQDSLDLRWTIPMAAEIDSFSLNAATAILLYEINRRKIR